MNKITKAVPVSVVLLFLFTHSAYSQQVRFSKEEVLEDLSYLRQSLEKAHYNLYAYVSKDSFNFNFKKVYRAINSKDSMDLLAITSRFQQVIAAANTGHAEIDFPAQSYIGYAQKGGTLFPIEIALENKKAFIRNNLSGNQRIKKGMQLISVNGQKVESIIEKIHPQLSAERMYFKNAKLEFWSFPRLYWQVFGEQKSFDIKLKHKGKTFIYTVESIPVMDYENKRNGEILNTNRDFYLIDDIAYLNPGPFSSNVEDGEILYKNFIDSVFAKIKGNNKKTLIVDLRNNSGGHNAYSDYLVSYFADQPFKWHSKFTIKTSEILKQQTRKYNDTTEAYFKAILENPDGKIYEYHYKEYEPVEEQNRFHGKVYVLNNRQTYSMAAVTAAMIQDYNFATIVGEETGDLPTLYASQFSYTLPKTGIVVKLPKGYIIRPNGTKELQGVIPDIEIRDHLLDSKDEILDGLLERLEKEH